MLQSDKQSNALRRLEKVLDDAVNNGNGDQPSGPILLKAMKLRSEPQNILDFYELLNKAKEEAEELKSISKIDRYLKALEDLHKLFTVNHLWTTKWSLFANHIENKNILIALDSLAYFFHAYKPTVLLEEDFLEKLGDKLNSILNDILESDLSKALKRLLTERIEDILKMIRRYHIDGHEGLEKAAKSLVSDLVITERRLDDSDKKNPIFKAVKSLILPLVFLISPTSLYDVVGAVPAIYDFWLPKLEDLVVNQREIGQIIDETSTIQEACEKILNIFSNQPQKSIPGSRELRALPPSKSQEEPESSSSEEEDNS